MLCTTRFNNEITREIERGLFLIIKINSGGEGWIKKKEFDQKLIAPRIPSPPPDRRYATGRTRHLTRAY